jgi:hypothetical protein
MVSDQEDEAQNEQDLCRHDREYRVSTESPHDGLCSATSRLPVWMGLAEVKLIEKMLLWPGALTK